jgi:hypothetical protein
MNLIKQYGGKVVPAVVVQTESINKIIQEEG